MKSGTITVWLAYPQQASQIDFTDAGTFLDSGAISIANQSLDMTISGWVRLGTAEVKLHFDPNPAALALPAVQALRESLAKFDAECETKRQFFLSQISKLEALPGVTA